MSKKIVIVDDSRTARQQVKSALADVGYAEVEEGDAVPLYGYQGDRRPETAALVLRRAADAAVERPRRRVHPELEAVDDGVGDHRAPGARAAAMTCVSTGRWRRIVTWPS